MIRLFLCDIDGCLSEAFEPFDLEGLARVRALAARGGPHGTGPYPAFSILTGRAHAYTEAYAQLLDTQVPVYFEAGAGAFDRGQARVTWHPAFTSEIEAALVEVRQWFFSDLLPGAPLAFDYGKRTQVGVISADRAAISAAAVRTRAFVASLDTPLQVFQTAISVDVVPLGLAKGDALAWISAMTGIALDEMGYIGDSEGDIEALRRVGAAFAPSNAVPGVREVVDVVTASPGLYGVLEAYEEIVARNAAELETGTIQADAAFRMRRS
ncbi:MAG TPA: HAD hydrolase family protein [Rhodothermales bacterium]|nr:HAD hydrolase family protein [Rhodothermales bacterium]